MIADADERPPRFTASQTSAKAPNASRRIIETNASREERSPHSTTAKMARFAFLRGDSWSYGKCAIQTSTKSVAGRQRMAEINHRESVQSLTIAFICRTSKMSHDGSWRAACLTRNWILILHFESPSVARGVTAPGVGSGALLAGFSPTAKEPIRASLDRPAGTARVALIADSLPQTRNREARHREPTFRKPMLTRAPTNRTTLVARKPTGFSSELRIARSSFG